MKKLAFLLFALLAFPCLSEAQGVSTAQVSVTPNSGAYVAGNCLGGVLTVPQMFRMGQDGGTILSNISITDTTGTDATIDVLIFNAKPSGTYTDHAACTVNSADQDNLVSVVPNTAFTCVQDSAQTTGICQASVGVLVSLATIPPAANSFWAVPIVRSTPTYGAAKTLYFNFKALPD
jgi:hypothetical protein